MNDALYKIRHGAENPAQFENAFKFSDCAKALSADQRLQILKDNYSEMIPTWRSNTTKEKTKLTELISESGVNGKQFIAAAELAMDPTTSAELQRKTLENMSGREAQTIVSLLISAVTHSESKADPNKLKVDFARLESLALDFMNDPTVMLQATGMGYRGALAHKDLVRMPLLLAEMSDRLKKIKDQNLDPRQFCKLIQMSTAALDSYSPTYPTAQIQADWIKNSKHVIDHFKKPDFECGGMKTSDWKNLFNKAWTEKSVDLGLALSASQTAPNALNTAPIPKEDCSLKDIRKWITYEIKNKYKWPSSYFGGEGIKKSCHIILMIQSGTKIVIDPTTKKKVKINTSKVKMEISHPQFSKVEDFESSESTLEYNLYSKFLDWGVFSDSKANPVIPTDNNRPAAAPASR